MERILDKVIEGYKDSMLRILNSQDDSIFHIIDLPNYRNEPQSKLSQVFPVHDVMNVLGKGGVIVIRHDTNSEFLSFSEALDAITQQDQDLQLQGSFLLVTPRKLFTF